MFIYLLIYIPFILCAWYDFDGKTGPKKKDQILWFWVIVFTLFRGLRWDTGTDWDQFLEVYNYSDWSNIFTYNRDEWSDKVMDYGYMFINAVFHKVGFPYTVFLLATNLWVMWCFKDFCIRHTNYPILTLLLILNVGIVFPVRQTISLATMFWGYRYLTERNWVKYVIVAICAILIHKGSVVALPLFVLPAFFDRFKIKWYYYALAYLSTFAIAAVLGEYIKLATLLLGGASESMSAYSEAYMNMEETSMAGAMGDFNNSAMNGLSYTLFFSLLLFIREKYSHIITNNIKSSEVFFFLYAISATIDNLIRQSDGSGMTEALGRVTTTIDMLPLFFPLLFVWAIRITSGKYTKMIGFFFIVYMMYKYWQQIPGAFFADLYIPYKCVLFE